MHSPLRNLKTELKDFQKYPAPLYVQDDLTQLRAKRAYLARQLKQHGRIDDTWVWDSKVLVKDLRGRIHQVLRKKDLEKFHEANGDG